MFRQLELWTGVVTSAWRVVSSVHCGQARTSLEGKKKPLPLRPLQLITIIMTIILITETIIISTSSRSRWPVYHHSSNVLSSEQCLDHLWYINSLAVGLSEHPQRLIYLYWLTQTVCHKMLICYWDFCSSCISNPLKYLFDKIILFRPCTCPECVIKVDWWSAWHIPGAGSLRWWPGFKHNHVSFAACHLFPAFSVSLKKKRLKEKHTFK